MDQIIKALTQKLGRVPTQAEISKAAREGMGATGSVPQPPTPGGITRENIQSGYGYQPGMLDEGGMSPLKKLLMIGGPAGIGTAALLSLINSGDSASSAAPDTSMIGDKSVSMGQKAAALGDLGLKDSLARRNMKSQTKKKAGLSPGEDELMRMAQMHASIPPPPAQAAPATDEREYFRQGPYQLGVR